MKKFLSVFLSILMLCSITAGVDLSASAATSGDWEYELLDDGTAQITDYDGDETNVTIPSTIDGYAVTGLWIYFYYYVETVSIPAGITDIGYIFGSGLTDITVDSANGNYSSSDGVLFNKAKTELILYPAEKTATSYTIPSTVTKIGYSAFNRCEKLTNITIPNTVTYIDAYAFERTGLTAVTIPSSVTYLSDDALFLCYDLTNITVDSNNSNYSSSSGVLFNKAKTRLIQYPASNTATAYTIPSTVTEIGRWAFCGSSNLTGVTLPNSVTYIGTSAFSYCSSLASITIPASVAEIGAWAFEECTSLTSITIMNSNCEIYDSEYTISDTAAIYGFANSTAQAYAAAYSRTFVSYTCSHTWNSGTVTKAATCKEAGVKTYTCTNCAETKTEAIAKTANHTWNSGITTKAATCGATGVKTYTCTVCGATKTETIAKTTSHTYGSAKYTTKATTDKKGVATYTCTVCGATKTKSYAKIKSVSLSASTYTYNGKAKTPTVTVKDADGNTISSKYYTVTYINRSTGKTVSSMKSVGKYYVKVTFKGKYSGSVKKAVTIKPKSTSISSVTANSKGFTVKWSKVTTQTTGYQVQYSTSSDFSNSTTKTISSNSTTSKKITGLKAKKKYYVRVRTYKTVKIDGKSTKIYSSWSKAKSVTTKK